MDSGERSRPRLRQQRLARPLRRSGPTRRLSRREAAHAARHRARRVRPNGGDLGLRWSGPGGHAHDSGVAVLASNNRYRLGRAVGSGTRPRIDDRLLGMTVVGAPSGRESGGRRLQRPWREWSAPAFAADADRPVPAGIDGEALVLEPPLTFHIRPGVLRVRIARTHPGASPSAAAPRDMAGVLALARIARGVAPHPHHHDKEPPWTPWTSLRRAQRKTECQGTPWPRTTIIPKPRTEPEFRAQRLGFALNSLAAELVTERRKVIQLQKELEQLKARLASP